jgi:hypothetical protein
LKFEISNIVKHGFNPNSFNISSIDYCKCNGFCVENVFVRKINQNVIFYAFVTKIFASILIELSNKY